MKIKPAEGANPMIFLNAIQSVLSIMIMIAIGYVLTKRDWFDENTSAMFSRLVMNITLPAMMVSNMMSFFDREQLLVMGMGFLIPLAGMLLSYGFRSEEHTSELQSQG